MERFVNAVQSLAVEGRPFTAITHQQQLMALDSFVGFVQSGALAEQQFHDHGLLLQDSLLQWLLSSQFALASDRRHGRQNLARPGSRAEGRLAV
jgi:hypothetical protein